MEDLPGNPIENALPQNINEADLAAAIEKSGFPFQIAIADRIRPHVVRIEEEWSYVDRDSGDLRTLDIYARHIPDLGEFHVTDLDVVPVVHILIECKQSAWPYVFFLFGGSAARASTPDVVGLRSTEMQVSNRDSERWEVPVSAALSLHELPFMSESFPLARIFSRAVFEKRELSLTDSEAYTRLVAPLTKAGDYCARTQKPPATANKFRAGIVWRLAVLDAPMVGVFLMNGRQSLARVPCVRVLRHLPTLEDGENRERIVPIDIVHGQYLETYLIERLIPFVNAFGAAVMRHQSELSVCRGTIDDLGEIGLEHAEQRLRL